MGAVEPMVVLGHALPPTPRESGPGGPLSPSGIPASSWVQTNDMVLRSYLLGSPHNCPGVILPVAWFPLLPWPGHGLIS